MKRLLITLLVIISFILNGGWCAPEYRDIQLTMGGVTILESPGYPNTSPEPGTSILWSITAPEGSNIGIKCSDVRISPSEGCKKGFLLISHSGGKSAHICGSETELKVTSNDNRMTVHFELIWAAGMVRCRVRASGVLEPPPPTEPNPVDVKKVFLDPEGKSFFEISERPVPLEEKLVWEFITLPRYKIGMRCPSLWFTYTGNCLRGNVTIDLGAKQEVICDRVDNATYVSSGSKLSIKLETTRSTVGFLVCTLIATKGPHFEPWRNLPWNEEDSSEHGLAQIKGPKETTCNCGWSNKATSRILNGEEAGPNEFPWMAAFRYKGATMCGASIITEYHVLTAAHCTAPFSAEDATVAVGINHLEKLENAQIIQALEFINHKGYLKNFIVRNDISIVVLAEKINFNQKVGPVCIPVFEPPHLYGSYITSTGWGLMSPEEMETRDRYSLKKTKLKAISMKECNLAYEGRYDTAPASQMCGWAPKSGTCFGDSGGPHVWLDPETNRYTQVSITSEGDGCKLQKPGVQTSVHYYYPWILESIRGSKYSQAKVCTRIE
uniref:Venom S1 protease with CUB domain 13 n=1 Tax=Oncocephalus sp. TaxID=2944721 RepID=A0AB38ZEQ1_9HEMI